MNPWESRLKTADFVTHDCFILQWEALIKTLRINEYPIVDSPASLVEGEDYYWEREAMVFTARYHLRRGYCCEHSCRHCPYEEVVTEDSSTLKKSTKTAI